MTSIAIRCPSCGFQFDDCNCLEERAPLSELSELIDQHIEQQGTSVITAGRDGTTVFTFTRETLEQLLARAIESGTGRVVVLVKSGARS